jgi:hypothetical protein
MPALPGSGAPMGNQNARKAKIWQQAIKRALARMADSTVDAGLDRLADKLVSAAVEGDQWAITEIGNRIDGRPAQAVTVSGDEDNPLVLKEIVIRTVHAVDSRPTPESG